MTASGWKVAFSGFRNSSLEEHVRNKGGEISNIVSGKTTHLVVKYKSSTTIKVQKANALGRYTKGRWRTIGEKGGPMKTLKILWEGLRLQTTTLDGMDAVDQENMRKNLMELLIWIGLLMTMALLKGAVDDEEEMPGGGSFGGAGAGDEWEGPSKDGVLIAVINILSRVESDITFYIHPTTFKQILKDPFPIGRTLQDFGKAFSATYKYLMGDKYGEDTIDAWIKALPFINSLGPKIESYSTVIFHDKEATSKSKKKKELPSYRYSKE